VEWFDSSALTLAVFLPLAGVAAVALLPRAYDGLIRGAALAATLLALLVGAAVVPPGSGRATWLRSASARGSAGPRPLSPAT